MSYYVILSPEAEDAFDRLPQPLQTFVGNQLDSLSINPSSISQASARSDPGAGMVAELDHEIDDRRHHVTIFWIYAQDEQTILVIYIAHFTCDAGADFPGPH